MRPNTLYNVFACVDQVEVILNEEELREEIGFLKRTLRTKRSLAALRADRGLQQNTAKPSCAPYEHSSTKITLLMDWVNAVCDFYNLRVSWEKITKEPRRPLYTFSSWAKENTLMFGIESITIACCVACLDAIALLCACLVL